MMEGRWEKAAHSRSLMVIGLEARVLSASQDGAVSAQVQSNSHKIHEHPWNPSKKQGLWLSSGNGKGRMEISDHESRGVKGVTRSSTRLFGLALLTVAACRILGFCQSTGLHGDLGFRTEPKGELIPKSHSGESFQKGRARASALGPVSPQQSAGTRQRIDLEGVSVELSIEPISQVGRIGPGLKPAGTAIF